jgi:sugar O-acyltransferase (sialic acid O-acetyltransferase NeuD family)
MDEIILIGGGGHCASCIDVIELEGRFSIIGIVDLPENIGQTLLDYPIIASDADLPELSKNYRNFHICLGQIKSPSRRIALYRQLRELNACLPTIISPQAYVSSHARIGAGTIVMHQAMVNAGADIGANCILNSRCLIEHDAVVGAHCHISTGAILNGGTQIAEKTFIGSGAIIRDHIAIGRNSLIGAGIRVMANLPENSGQPE